ncbi:hypothetical protein GSI_02402 [Ganoderma sinense ZZ0214-1]|uniref:Aminotransferase class V domain-containing protein n=1 Tax=Ganoderma sinense ZZ0214-1 TaxID=1077348 RepID=A0A2G8SPK1_9APHY|nr:hypothetical protein GSI_02402 [Ganoderma sinense ZZ0214-1]
MTTLSSVRGTYDLTEKPSPFGHALKKFFALDPDYVNLNNGSYGSVPWPVLHKTIEEQIEVERNPDRFHRLSMRPLLRQAREFLAPLVGAELDEIVLVPNVMAAINDVLRNFDWQKGDVIIKATTTYENVLKGIQYLADRPEHVRPHVETIELTFPTTHSHILDTFRARVKEIKALHAARGSQFTHVPSVRRSPERDSGNKVVAVIDAISSNPGVRMPWKEMVRICREEGAWSLVDAAHSLGQELDIDLSEARPDFWVSNCHKWLYAKRGCAILYVPKQNQYIIKSAIPTPSTYVSPSSPEAKELGTNFVLQHEWTGAIDVSPYLSIAPALAFRGWLGGEHAINNYCHALALAGGRRLAAQLGTRVMDDELVLNTVDVQLSLPVERAPGEIYSRALNRRIHPAFQEKVLRFNVYAAHYFHAGAWWTRCSAQVFNELEDFDRVGEAFIIACQEVEGEFLGEHA